MTKTTTVASALFHSISRLSYPLKRTTYLFQTLEIVLDENVKHWMDGLQKLVSFY